MSVADPHRLPRTAIPHRYELVIEPDLDQATFRGSVEVYLEIAETLSEIVLNAVDLDITRATLRVGENNAAVEGTVSYQTEVQRAVVG
ncbi:MAG: hypothetical protein F4Z61_06695, partial [Acidimicrobiia bacterium]|nr:hypothetical protein [Acidimicrobiia bacterium]